MIFTQLKKEHLLYLTAVEPSNRRTLDPEVDVLTAEADAIQHLAAVDARVVALQRPVEGEGVVGNLHAVGHQPVQPAPETDSY